MFKIEFCSCFLIFFISLVIELLILCSHQNCRGSRKFLGSEIVECSLNRTHSHHMILVFEKHLLKSIDTYQVSIDIM